MRLKCVLMALAALAFSAAAMAQEEEDTYMFNHLSVGVNVGTPGYGFDVAVPVGKHFQLRAGFSTMPKIKASTDLDFNGVPSTGTFNVPSSIKIEAKPGFSNAKILVDIYPFNSSNFHITGGAYWGSSEVVTAYNKEEGVLKDVADWNRAHPSQLVGLELGDYLLTPDAAGNVSACVKTASFKPYLGIGFGRAVPRKNRLGFMFELGTQFWGTPKVYCNGTELTPEGLDADGGAIVKVLSKVKVYPVMNFRLCGRIL